LTSRISVRIPEQARGELERIADEQDLRVSDLIRRSIRSIIAAEGGAQRVPVVPGRGQGAA
jgi:metal-responsive CopG/Arc/MetJ family transcriptional regulator